MKRIVLHWSGGSHTASVIDREHYHFIVDGAGKTVAGIHPVSANENARQGGEYAAHTLNCNSGSIGIAMAAMYGAVERPFSAGRYPITEAQLSAFIALAARLAREYSIPVTRETILSHAEVWPTLNIKQRGKWDIAWLPGMASPEDPVKVGDRLRARIAAAMVPTAPEPVAPEPQLAGWAGFFAAIAAAFGGRK